MSLFRPYQKLEEFWKNLPKRKKEEREKDVLYSRFAIGRQKETLQSIGRRYNITRERVRQIQNQGLKSLKKVALKEKKFFQRISKKLSSLGKVISLKSATSLLLGENAEEKEKKSLHLLLVINPFIEYQQETSFNYPFFTKNIESSKVKKDITKLINFFTKKENALTIKEACNIFKFPLKYLKELGEISKFLGMREGKIGLLKSSLINPKTAKQKIDFILEKYRKPLHFTEIAKLIEKENFQSRNPSVAALHNELIKHTNNYVLIGRGIYALRKWGYLKGTVKDVIKQILKNAKKPLSKEEVIKKVMEQRMVKRNTILLNLAKFKDKLK